MMAMNNMKMFRVEDYFEELKKRGFVLGLDNMYNVLDALGNPEDKQKIVTIGGTNGKGSTVAYLSAILREKGLKVGTFTSPEIVVFNDRIRINEKNISMEDLEAITLKIKKITEENNIPITEFEMITAIAIEYFAQEKCDITLLEVGMGGRLDATNAVKDPILSIITRIGLDHTNFLGDTIEEITMEKAGIIKENTPVVLYNEDETVYNIIHKVCEEKNSNLVTNDLEAIKFKEMDLNGIIFDYKDYKNLKLSMLGRNQMANASIALESIQVIDKLLDLKITEKDIREGFKKGRIIGRFQKISDKPLILLDGGHNLQAVTALKENLDSLFPNKKIVFITAFLKDKDYRECIKIVGPLSKIFLTVEPDNPRKLDSNKLRDVILEEGFKAINMDHMENALNFIHSMYDTEIIVIFGSLFEIREVLDYFEGD